MTHDYQRVAKASLTSEFTWEYGAAALAWMAAVLYNVWPLGFWLDPQALHRTYVSVLEVPGRPHAHLFAACDLAAGAFAAVAGLLLGRRAALAGHGLLVFGLGTVAEALMPIAPDCAASVAACGIDLGQVLAPHDIASIVSALGLAVSVLAIRRRTGWSSYVTGLWIAAGLFLVASIVIGRFTMSSQALFLLACGMALVVVPLLSGPDTVAPCPPGSSETRIGPTSGPSRTS